MLRLNRLSGTWTTYVKKKVPQKQQATSTILAGVCTKLKRYLSLSDFLCACAETCIAWATTYGNSTWTNFSVRCVAQCQWNTEPALQYQKIDIALMRVFLATSPKINLTLLTLSFYWKIFIFIKLKFPSQPQDNATVQCVSCTQERLNFILFHNHTQRISSQLNLHVDSKM